MNTNEAYVLDAQIFLCTRDIRRNRLKGAGIGSLIGALCVTGALAASEAVRTNSVGLGFRTILIFLAAWYAIKLYVRCIGEYRELIGQRTQLDYQLMSLRHEQAPRT